MAESPCCRAFAGAPSGRQPQPCWPPPHPPFRRDCFSFLCGGGNDSVELPWCHGAAHGLRGRKLLSLERRDRRAVPCGARGRADPGCCAAAAAKAKAKAKAGGGLERRQRQPGELAPASEPEPARGGGRRAPCALGRAQEMAGTRERSG